MRVKVTETRKYEYTMDVNASPPYSIPDNDLLTELRQQKDDENVNLFNLQAGTGELWKGGVRRNGNRLATTTITLSSDKFVSRRIEKTS